MQLLIATIAGLFAIGGGILIWVKAPVLAKVAVSSLDYLRPGKNQEAFRRTNIKGVRFVAATWIAAGIGVIIYHLVAR
ncbi:hypothetical protein HP499_02220 [Paenarthrobacter sp. CM16]|uniref:hypothetical protein n=1 Tax=Paenarthrobacter sp. CM16 TaxID=2738447 RepID=UPI001557E3F6|nr:hypothetical protein [Paenarthrobacter sp. CM16]NQD86630.1 hypothetical protein [Paenarthrobacter sp. CM16]